MDIADFKQLLNSNGLKATLSRLKIFAVFSAHNNAITQVDIEQEMEKHADRVTLYRTLRTFERYGIIHRIIGGNGIPNFALNLSPPGRENKKPSMQHLHFSCLKCKSVYCLNDRSVPQVTLPASYEVYSLNMVVTGVCRMCNRKA